MKKTILIIIVVIIVALGIGGYFVLKKSGTAPIVECGDNICDEFEKYNPSACPSDCKLTGNLSSKEQMQNSPFGFADLLALPAGVSQLKVDESLNGFSFSNEDQFYNYILDKANLLGTKFVRDNVFYAEDKLIEGTVPILTKFKDNNWSILIQINTWPEGLPANTDSFKRAVRDLVQKYHWIKYWQIGNEMDKGEGWKKNYRQFPEYFLMTRKAIKEVCGDCKIALGGISNQYNPSEQNYQVYEFIIGELVKTLDKPFDIFDFHYYARDHQSIKKTADAYRTLLAKYNIKDVEMWVTEIGVYSGKVETGLPFQDEKYQANELLKDHVLLLSSGVKKILWPALIESNGAFPASFNRTGLIYNGLGDDDMGAGVKKLSYYTYKKMVEVLEGSDWDNIQTIQEQGGVYVYKFLKAGKPIWVAWNDNASEKQITISGVNSPSVKITEAVPNYSSGKEVTSYNTAFKTENKQITNNKLTVTLNETPVFIEGI